METYILKTRLADVLKKCADPGVPGHVTNQAVAKLAAAGACQYHINEILESRLLNVLKTAPEISRGEGWSRLLASNSEARDLRAVAKRLPGPAVRPVRQVEKIDLAKVSPAWAKIEAAGKEIQKANPGMSLPAARGQFLQTEEGQALREQYSAEVKAHWSRR